MMRSPRFLRSSLAVGLVLSMAGCASNISSDSYKEGQVGQASRTLAGVIVSSRVVDVEGNSSVGGLVGSAAGGVAGSAIGGGFRANALGAIGGALLGGMLGSSVEKGASKQQAIEYVIQTDSNGLITVAQGTDQPLAVGQRVLVIEGKQARVIADTRPDAQK
ncbi:glycine zipper 2TM domain-containing protein [Leminorella grimontii]|uniref:glycine zipper 2TM domain-containing protein n=1 Tax=Leminorella grimontii TaxID=82981 RepID=UPI003220068E